MIGLALALMLLNGLSLLSARCVSIANPDDDGVDRIQIAPGAAPILSFRLYEGQAHHQFGNAELLLDDAGH